MYRRPSPKKQIVMRVLTYVAMTLSVLAIVSALVFVILGYRIDANNGQIEQGALLQFETVPGGASVTIDGKTIGSKTSTKSSVQAGSHTFIMKRDGYETWQKTVDVKAGTLTWLDYARLVPKNRKAESVASYPALYGSLGTADGSSMIVQQSASAPTFQIVDLRSDNIKTTNLTIPTNLYSEATTADVAHTFTINQWDSGGRYVLLRHNYGDKKEWLVLDTKDVAATKNVTTLLDLDISQVVFSGTSGNILYALSSGDIRKLDLSAGTISRSLVTNVGGFGLFETNIITYVGTDPKDAAKRVVGFYREGDNTPHVLRTVTGAADIPLHITTSRYFNEDYVAISLGTKIDILKGSIPSSGSDDNNSLTAFASFTFATNASDISFSPKGDYLLVQSGASFASYDIEHMRIIEYVTLTMQPGVTVNPVKWLDDDHTWSDYEGSLIMREFDGANATTINQSVGGQGVALTSNDKYIYSLGKTATGFQLQRVRMVLP